MKTGKISPDNKYGYNITEEQYWVEELCPKCGAQLIYYNSGQSCGIVCLECDYFKWQL